MSTRNPQRRSRHLGAAIAGIALALSVSIAHSQSAGSDGADAGDRASGVAEADARAQARAKAAAEARERKFGELLAAIEELEREEAELARRREADAQAELEAQVELARGAEERRDRAEAQSAALDRDWARNEERVKEVTALLQQHQGNLGELFGVTRQVAGDAAGVLGESLLGAALASASPDTLLAHASEGESDARVKHHAESKSTSPEERTDFMRRLAGATALPSIDELRRLWIELLREMKATGEVVRFTTDVLTADGADSRARDVVRVGTFTATAEGDFLGYLPSERRLTELHGTLPAIYTHVARELAAADAAEGYVPAVVDPASGALLGVYLERPSLIDRIENGEVVGYVIIAVGVIGLLAAAIQFGYLVRTRIAVRSQLTRLDRPTPDNPLGRVLLAVGSAEDRVPDAALVDLRLSEAVLREVPKLERCQSFLRLAVAAGPLLGLIGTVIGMILTFETITASGSSDPKLMARGIGQAMIATVLGLGIAIPLLFVNAGLAALSNRIVQVLEEQSQRLLAATMLRSSQQR